MITCPTCGTRNPQGQPACRACGGALTEDSRSGTLFAGTAPDTSAPAGAPAPDPDQVSPTAARPQPKHTMVGVAPLAAGAAPQPEPTQKARAQAKQTMIGLAPLAAGAAPAAPAQRANPKQTMLGVAPPPAAAAGPVTTPPAAPDVAPAPETRPAAQGPGLGTTLPSAAPSPMGSGTQIMTEGSGVPPTQGTAAPAQPLPSRHKTQLGIAHPGIAPLQPQTTKASAEGLPPIAGKQPSAPPGTPAVNPDRVPPTAPFSAAPQSPKTPSQAPTLVSAETDPQEKARARSLRVAAITVVSLALLIGVAIVVLAIAIRARGPVQANVSLDGEGNEVLRLSCAGCEDGTIATLGGEEATFRSRSAAVSVRDELEVGNNELTVTLRHPDGRTEDIDLVVPVEYRLNTTLEGLAADPPSVKVQIAATRETAVVVDGSPVALDANGEGVADVDVSQSLTGPATTVTRLDRKIPYTVTPRHGEPENGELTLRIGVVPLVVDAPGASITIDKANFWLAGRTMKGGTISVGGRPITVDPEGRFAQLMNVSSVGETTIFIRAQADEHAPRLVPLRVRRVEDLRSEAQRLGAKATRSYATIAQDLEAKQDWQVMLEGTISEIRTSNHTTVLLLDVTSGCEQSPCLARARLGAKLSAASGDVVTVIGRVNGAVEFGGRRIPEVRADFVLAGPAP